MADVAFLFGCRLALRPRRRLATGADVDCNAASDVRVGTGR